MSVELPTLFIKGRENKDVRLIFINTTFCQPLSLKNGAFSMANLYSTVLVPQCQQYNQPSLRFVPIVVFSSSVSNGSLLLMAFQNCPFRVFVFGSSSRFLLALFRSLRAMWHFLFPISTTLERKQTNKNLLICCSHHEDLRYVRVCMCVESSVVFAAVVAMNGRWPSGRMYRSCRCRTVPRIRAVERFHSCGCG